MITMHFSFRIIFIPVVIFQIANLVKTRVHLFLFVKVNENWMKNIDNFENIKLDKLPL